MVRRVKEKQETYPKIIDGIIEAIGDLTYQAVFHLKKRELRGLGEVININQGLLYSLGVSHEALERLIFASLKGEAYGAKLVGAGGGGYMVALCRNDKTQDVAVEIESAGGKAILTNKTDQGVTAALSLI